MANQKKVDAKAMRQKNAVGADDAGGQDYPHPGQRVHSDQKKPGFKGIRMHDPSEETWGLGK